jgi:hypothetical protein
MDNRNIKDDAEEKDSRTLELLKIRSVSADIRDGIRLYLNTFRSIFRSSWLAALFYALVTGGMMTYCIGNVTNLLKMQMEGHLTEDNSELMLLGAGFAVCMLLAIIASTLLYSSGLSLLSRHSETGAIPTPAHWYGSNDKRTILRTSLWMLATVVIIAVYEAIIFAIKQWLTGELSPMSLTILIGITTIIMLIALPIIMMRMLPYILNKDNKSPMGYGIPVRTWGSTLTIAIVVVIMIGIASIVTTLPSLILLAANIQSLGGTIYGDPTGMPSYMIWMNMGVFTLAGFIQAYVNLSSLFPFYYLYGSIETQKKERKDYNEIYEKDSIY